METGGADVNATLYDPITPQELENRRNPPIMDVQRPEGGMSIGTDGDAVRAAAGKSDTAALVGSSL